MDSVLERVPSPMYIEEVSTSVDSEDMVEDTSPTMTTFSPQFTPSFTSVAISGSDIIPIDLNFVRNNSEEGQCGEFYVQWVNFNQHLRRTAEDEEVQRLVTEHGDEGGVTIISIHKNYRTMYRAKLSTVATGSLRWRAQLMATADNPMVIIEDTPPHIIHKLMQYITSGFVQGNKAHLQEFINAKVNLRVGAVWPDDYVFYVGILNDDDRGTMIMQEFRVWSGFNFNGQAVIREGEHVPMTNSTELSDEQQSFMSMPVGISTCYASKFFCVPTYTSAMQPEPFLLPLRTFTEGLPISSPWEQLSASSENGVTVLMVPTPPPVSTQAPPSPPLYPPGEEPFLLSTNPSERQPPSPPLYPPGEEPPEALLAYLPVDRQPPPQSYPPWEEASAPPFLLPPGERPSSPPFLLPPAERPPSPPFLFSLRERPPSPPFLLPPRKRPWSPPLYPPGEEPSLLPLVCSPGERSQTPPLMQHPVSPSDPKPPSPPIYPPDELQYPIFSCHPKPPSLPLYPPSPLLNPSSPKTLSLLCASDTQTRSPPMYSYDVQPPSPPLYPDDAEQPSPPQYQGDKQPPSPPLYPDDVPQPSPPQYQGDKQPPSPPLDPDDVQPPSPPLYQDDVQQPSHPFYPDDVQQPSPPVYSDDAEQPSPPLYPDDAEQPSPLFYQGDKQPPLPPLYSDDVQQPSPPLYQCDKQPPSPLWYSSDVPAPLYPSEIQPSSPPLYPHGIQPPSPLFYTPSSRPPSPLLNQSDPKLPSPSSSPPGVSTLPPTLSPSEPRSPRSPQSPPSGVSTLPPTLSPFEPCSPRSPPSSRKVAQSRPPLSSPKVRRLLCPPAERLPTPPLSPPEVRLLVQSRLPPKDHLPTPPLSPTEHPYYSSTVLLPKKRQPSSQVLLPKNCHPSLPLLLLKKCQPPPDHPKKRSKKPKLLIPKKHSRQSPTLILPNKRHTAPQLLLPKKRDRSLAGSLPTSGHPLPPSLIPKIRRPSQSVSLRKSCRPSKTLSLQKTCQPSAPGPLKKKCQPSPSLLLPKKRRPSPSVSLQNSDHRSPPVSLLKCCQPSPAFSLSMSCNPTMALRLPISCHLPLRTSCNPPPPQQQKICYRSPPLQQQKICYRPPPLQLPISCPPLTFPIRMSCNPSPALPPPTSCHPSQPLNLRMSCHPSPPLSLPKKCHPSPPLLLPKKRPPPPPSISPEPLTVCRQSPPIPLSNPNRSMVNDMEICLQNQSLNPNPFSNIHESTSNRKEQEDDSRPIPNCHCNPKAHSLTCLNTLYQHDMLFSALPMLAPLPPEKSSVVGETTGELSPTPGFVPSKQLCLQSTNEIPTTLSARELMPPPPPPPPKPKKIPKPLNLNNERQVYHRPKISRETREIVNKEWASSNYFNTLLSNQSNPYGVPMPLSHATTFPSTQTTSGRLMVPPTTPYRLPPRFIYQQQGLPRNALPVLSQQMDVTPPGLLRREVANPSQTFHYPYMREPCNSVQNFNFPNPRPQVPYGMEVPMNRPMGCLHQHRPEQAMLMRMLSSSQPYLNQTPNLTRPLPPAAPPPYIPLQNVRRHIAPAQTYPYLPQSRPRMALPPNPQLAPDYHRYTSPSQYSARSPIVSNPYQAPCTLVSSYQNGVQPYHNYRTYPYFPPPRASSTAVSAMSRPMDNLIYMPTPSSPPRDTPTIVICKWCGLTFGSARTLRAHQLQNHRDPASLTCFPLGEVAAANRAAFERSRHVNASMKAIFQRHNKKFNESPEDMQ